VAKVCSNAVIMIEHAGINIDESLFITRATKYVRDGKNLFGFFLADDKLIKIFDELPQTICYSGELNGDSLIHTSRGVAMPNPGG